MLSRNRLLSPQGIVFALATTLLVHTYACNGSKSFNGSDGTTNRPSSTNSNGSGTNGNPNGQPNTSGLPGGNGAPSGTTPGTNGIPLCQNAQTFVSANIIALVDNSSSMSETDCPGRVEAGNVGGRMTYTCSQETARLVAVRNAANALTQMGDQAPSRRESVGTFSIVKFTPKNIGGSGQILMQPTRTLSNQLAPNRVNQAMSSFQSPDGDTPWLQAAQLARQVGAQIGALGAGLPTVALLITDGEPTDRNPQEVLNQANALKAANMIWITVMLNGGQRQDQHRKILNDYNEYSVKTYGQNWFSSNYKTFDEYFAAIQSLPGSITDQKYTATPQSLSEVIAREVLSKQTRCQ